MFFDFASFLPRAVMQGIPLLYGSTGEILTEKSGNLNLGIPGVMYVGGICGVIGAFFYEQSVASAAEMSAVLAIGIPMLASLLGSLIMGLIYCLLTVTLRANQNVTGLALTTFGVGIGNFFGGSLIKLTGSEVPSIALSATSAYFSKSLPIAETTGWFGQVFLSYGFLAYLAIIIALLSSYFLKHTRTGLHLRAVFYSFYVTHHITPFVIACLLYYMVFITTSCDFISFNVVLSFWSYNKYLFWLFSYIQSSSIMTGIKQILTKKEKNTDEHSRTV